LERGWQLYDQWAAGGRVADSKKIALIPRLLK
jgi:hypothetical protein